MADEDPQIVARPPIRAEIAGNRLELIESGEARLRTLLELIGGAERSIKMLMYMFNPDRVGYQVRDALVAAAARGVHVSLLIDGFGSAASADFFAPLKRAGGDECVFNPSYGRSYLLRDHQKLIVFDDSIVIVGGANIDDTYLTDRGPRHWRDLWLRLEGPEAALPSRYFDTLFRWSKRKNPRLNYLRRQLAQYSEWRGPLQWKFGGPRHSLYWASWRRR